jgi:hypothetical protein
LNIPVRNAVSIFGIPSGVVDIRNVAAVKKTD